MTDALALATKLKIEGEKLSAFMSALSAGQWNVQVYTEGDVWTIRSILAHLMTAERAFVRLFDGIRLGEPGVSDEFAIDRYNASQQRKTRQFGPQELLVQYQEARREMVVLVTSLTDADLEKKGRHPFLGETSLRDMVKMLYIHNQTHFRDVRRALKADG